MTDPTLAAIMIYNLHTAHFPCKATRVDRGTDWGNPFIMHNESERHAVCDAFEDYAKWRRAYQPDWLVPLHGKNLACWCAPKRCHAETLRRLANG